MMGRGGWGGELFVSLLPTSWRDRIAEADIGNGVDIVLGAVRYFVDKC